MNNPIRTMMTQQSTDTNCARPFFRGPDDVVLQTFTCNELCNVLLAIHRRGVKVRVIVCGSTVHAKGSDIMQIKEAHIPVRCIKSEQSYHGGSLMHPLMHHKFVVADKNVPGSEILITGSLNWTRNAILNNNENLLIVRGAPDACAAYAAEFERLWIRGTQPE